MNLSPKQSLACDLYVAGKTQKEIADEVGVTDRTIRSWIHQFSWVRLREAALSAPTILAERISMQLMNIFNAIDAREDNKGIPTVQEADMTRKLVNCLDKFKKYPTMGSTMEANRAFIHFIEQRDAIFGYKMYKEYKEYYKQQAKNGFMQCSAEFNANPMAYTFRDQDMDLNNDEMFKEDYDIKCSPLTVQSDVKPVEKQSWPLPEDDEENELETSVPTGSGPLPPALPDAEKSGNLEEIAESIKDAKLVHDIVESWAGYMNNDLTSPT